MVQVGGVAAATGTGGRDTRPHPWDQRVRTQDPERGEVTAYQDGVWLGRAIVPVDAIAPGEAPPEKRGPVCKLVRGQGGCWGQAPGSPG